MGEAMNSLPYEVNNWVLTEQLVATFKERFDDFSLTEKEEMHLVDLLGRLVPGELAEGLIDCRACGGGVVRARHLVSQQLRTTRDDERVTWVMLMLVGFNC